MTKIMTPIVSARAGDVVASSRDVAAIFEKEVKHVHEAIKNLIKNVPEVDGINFRPIYSNDLTGKFISRYDITRDGFTLLAMGFTGKKALKFKLDYIEAFNQMEAELRQAEPTIPDFSDPVAAARAWADELERKRAALAIT